MPIRDHEVERRPVVETRRLVLRQLDVQDAPFVLRLLNEPDFLRFIGDRGVKSIEDAVRYIETGPMESYRTFGHGLFLVETRSNADPVGICGVMRKPWLDGPDLAYAILAEAAGRGYASEAAAAAVSHAQKSVGLDRLVAIVVPENAASRRILYKLGFRADGRVTSPEGVELEHLVLDLRTTEKGER